MREVLNLESENKFNLEINQIKKLSNKSKTKSKSLKKEIDFAPTLTKLLNILNLKTF